MALVIRRFDIFLVSLDPTRGHEIRKTRPCVVISPNEMNRYIGTVIIAPMTTAGREYPSRIPILFRRKQGYVVLDQIRTVDKTRLVKYLGRLRPVTVQHVLGVLQEMFSD